jgi:LysM repeat protein
MSHSVLRRYLPPLIVGFLAAGVVWLLSSGEATPVYSFPGYQSSLPNGSSLFNNAANFAGSNSCLLCHGWNAGSPGNQLSSGTAGFVAAALKPFSSGPWGGHPAAALVDSDGDGFTNGEELQDPQGTWINTANNTVGDQAFVSNPNSNTSYPPAPIVSSANGLASNQTISGKVAIWPNLRYAGLNRVVFTFASATQSSAITVNSPAVTNYSAEFCLGSATAATGACPAWDSSALPDGVYTVTIRAYDKLVASLGGPQVGTLQLTGVTIKNTAPAPTATPTNIPPTATPTNIPPTATPTQVPPSQIPPTATGTGVSPTATPTSAPTQAPTDPAPITPTVSPHKGDDGERGRDLDDSKDSSDRPGTHVVRKGDTLYRLARRFGTSIQELMTANGLTTGWLRVGQVLAIPGAGAPLDNSSGAATPVPARHDDGQSNERPQAVGQTTTYTVKPGDNLFRISLRFKVSLSALWAANNLSTNIIRAGQVLVIP